MLRNIDPNQLRPNAEYIAGLVDGEGDLTIRWDKRVRYVRFSCLISIGMTDEPIIKWLADIFGVTIRKGKQYPKKKTMYYAQVLTKTNLRTLLKELLPLLKVKKERARIMLEFLNLRDDGSAVEFAKKQAELYLKMRKLNQEEGKAKKIDLEKERREILQRIETLQKEKQKTKSLVQRAQLQK